MKTTINLTRKTLLSMVFVGSSISAQAAIIDSPAITGFSSQFNTFFAPANVFNNSFQEFASLGDGTDTFLEFTFPAPTTFDRMVVVNRNAPANDRIKDYTLTFDGGAGGSRSVTRADLGIWSGGFDVLGTTTATTVRLDVDTVGDLSAGLNTGAMEIYFLNTPTGMSLISGVSVFDSSPPFNAGFASSNAVDGIIALGENNGEFATSGTGAFLEMDLGSLQNVGGFDFFDRITTAESNTSFDLTFSVDDIFGNEDDIVQNYTGSTQSAEFAGIDARYVRYEQTGGAGNSGVAEIQFYAIPESSGALLFAPTNYDFAETTISTPIQETISITNGGVTQTLNIASVTPVGGDAANFTVDSFPTTLAAGASGDITVTFDPMGSSGDYTTTLEISSDEGGTPGTITSITLSAPVFPDPFLFQEPISLVFPPTATDSTATLPVFLFNEGLTQELVITSAVITGPDADKFSIVTAVPASIPAIAFDSIDIEFDPSGTFGSFSATLEVTSNDNGVPGTVTTTALSGIGGTLANQPLSNATGGIPWSEVQAPDPADVLNDPFAFDPNAPTSAAPDQTWPTGLFLTQNNDIQNFWECEIDLSNGATLQFLDVWGRIDYGPGEQTRHQDLIITLSNGVDSWSSAPWNGVSTNVANPASYGRFDFSSAGVTPASLLQNATFLSIDHSLGNGDFLLLAEVRASGISGTTSSAFDTWASDQGLDGSLGRESGLTDDPDTGGFSNLGEFGLGGNPLDPSDDEALVNVFTADLVGGAEAEGILTILVRSGATFSPSGNDQVSTIDGITYTIIGDNTLPLASGTAVTATTPITTDLPPAPADYEYASFYISGSKGFFQVTVEAAP